jgi:uncharacterized membrane protein
MIIFIPIILVFILFYAIKMNKKRKINNIMLKPLKYSIDTRRSPWNRGSGGF